MRFLDWVILIIAYIPILLFGVFVIDGIYELILHFFY